MNLNETCFLSEQLDPNEEPTEDDILQKALSMGMDPVEDRQFFHLAKESLTSPMPKYWKPVVNSKNQNYYVDLMTTKAYLVHPVDMLFMKKYESAKGMQQSQFEDIPLERISKRLRKMVEDRRKTMNITVNAIQQENSSSQKAFIIDYEESEGSYGSRRSDGRMSPLTPHITPDLTPRPTMNFRPVYDAPQSLPQDELESPPFKKPNSKRQKLSEKQLYQSVTRQIKEQYDRKLQNQLRLVQIRLKQELQQQLSLDRMQYISQYNSDKIENQLIIQQRRELLMGSDLKKTLKRKQPYTQIDKIRQHYQKMYEVKRQLELKKLKLDKIKEFSRELRKKKEIKEEEQQMENVINHAKRSFNNQNIDTNNLPRKRIFDKKPATGKQVSNEPHPPTMEDTIKLAKQQLQQPPPLRPRPALSTIHRISFQLHKKLL